MSSKNSSPRRSRRLRAGVVALVAALTLGLTVTSVAAQVTSASTVSHRPSDSSDPHGSRR